ncbi:MAG TPA: SDR family oxidoreductase, partial [Tepidisphaeraceae bacterium]|nr:SDR family oxidoreductase [Tepidisphaeraceae bacterium]
MIDLKGHKALITGSRSGVGKAFAIDFARAGCDVLVHGRSADDAAMEVVEACRKCGVKSEFVGGDLATNPYEAVDQLFAAATKAMPGIDILVNNAGWFRDVAYLEMTRERFEQTMSVNVTVPYFLTQKFAKYWIEKKVHGRVLITGSINGRLAEEGSTAYDTSKGAVEMMVRTLAVAL